MRLSVADLYCLSTFEQEEITPELGPDVELVENEFSDIDFRGFAYLNDEGA